MQVIGLLGGVASGKSLVARQLGELGAGILDADGAGHQVLLEPEVEASVRARWGAGVFGPEGRVSRAALARIVFAPPPDGPRELAALEAISHPRIGALLSEQIARLATQGTPAVVLDAPVMLKAGWDRYCDCLVFVDSPRGQRLARAQSRGWTEADFAAREAAQENVDEKRSRAQFVIDNSGSPEDTRRQVAKLWNRLVAGGASADA